MKCSNSITNDLKTLTKRLSSVNDSIISKQNKESFEFLVENGHCTLHDALEQISFYESVARD